MGTSRRQFIQGLIALVGGTTLCSACAEEVDILPTELSNSVGRFFNKQEIQFLSRVCDLLIPRTQTPGALDAGVPAFIDGFIVDWASAETKTSVRHMLGSIERELNSRSKVKFVDTTLEVAHANLEHIDALAFDGETESLAGYPILKALVVNSFFASEVGATEVLDWRLVPGRWDGCAPLQKTGESLDRI